MVNMTNQYYCTIIEFGTPEFDQALRIRYRVLKKPLNLDFDPEDIANEYDSFHLACYDSLTDEMAAILVLKPLDTKALKMRQVAVDQSYQSKKVGSFLISESEKLAVAKGYNKIELHARDTAVEFYVKAGYSILGDVFQEVGINHFFMYKNLS
jgi:predicted GNAT family N-acyltransferase